MDYAGIILFYNGAIEIQDVCSSQDSLCIRLFRID